MNQDYPPETYPPPTTVSVNRFNRFLCGFRRVLTGPTIHVFLCAAGASQAATLTWDGNGNTAPNPNGGAGTWDVATTSNWWDGANNVVWPAAGGTDDDAVFANTAGTVTLAASGVTANDLTFSTTGYVIQSNTLTLNGATSVITTDANVSATISSILAGSANITKAGAGTLTLSSTSANTITGKVSVTGGVLAINADARLGTAPGSAVADQLTLNGGTLRITAGNQTLAANRGITIGSSGAILDTDALADTSNNSTTISGAISGTGPLTIASNGNLTATGGGSNTLGIKLNNNANSFTGDITITTGLVSYSNNTAFGNAANKIILNGGGLLDAGTNTALSRDIQVNASGGTFRGYGSTNVTWSGALTGSGNVNRTDGGNFNLSGNLSAYTGTYNNQAGTTTFTGTTSPIGGNWTISGGTLGVNSTANLSIAGTVSGSGAFSKLGTGSVKLTNFNTTYTGTTAAGAGTLIIGQNSAFGTGPINVTAGAKLSLSAGSGMHEGSISTSALNTTALNPATAVVNGTPRANSNTGWTASQQWNYSGYIKVNGTSDVTWTFAANIDDSTNLTVDGRTIINDGTYNTTDVGTITLSPGWHRIDARFHNGGGGAGASGANTGGASNWTTSKGFGLNQAGGNSLNANSYTTLSDPGDASFLTQDLIVANNIALPAGSNEIEVTSGATMTGVISGAGGPNYTGTGSLLFANGSNTYTGVTTLSGGRVSVASVGNGGVTGNLGASSNAASNLVFNGGSLRYTGSSSLTDRAFTINSGLDATIEVTSALTNFGLSGAPGSSTGALIKTGPGTLTLSGNSAYTGNTTISSGTLAVNGSLTSAVTVASGATLSGTNGSTSSTLTLATGSNIVGVPSVNGAGNAFRAAGAVTTGTGITINGIVPNSPPGVQTLDILGYGVSPGTAGFSLSKYRAGASLTDDTTNQKITLSYSNAQRTWTGLTGTWDVLTSTPWQEGDLKYAEGDNVRFNDTGIGYAGSRTITLNTTVNPGNISFESNITAHTVSGSGAISGPTSITKSGTGIATISSTNNYTGGTTINGGQLVLRSSNGLGLGAVTINTGGQLAFGPTGLSVPNNITLNGGSISGGLDSGTISNTLSGTLTLGTNGGTLTTYWSDKTLVVANPIVGSGPLTIDLHQVGNNAPNITMLGANTYSGTTYINNGTLQIGNAAYQGVTYQLPIVTGGTSGTTGTGSIVNNGTLVFARTSNLAVNNAISGNGTVIVRSNQTTTFGGTDSITGSILYLRTNVGSGGTIVFNKPANSNAVAFSTVYLGGESSAIYGNNLNLNLAASEQIADTSILRIESGRYGGSSLFSLLGNNETIAGLTYQGSNRGTGYVQNNSATTASTLTINNPDGTLYSFQADGTTIVRDGAAGKLNLVKNGTGTQVFQNLDHTGTTSINAGTFRIQSGRLNSSATTLGSATLEIRSSTVNAALSGTGTQVAISGGAANNFGGGNKTYSAPTVLSGASTSLVQTAASSLSANSSLTLGTGTSLDTGNFTGSVKSIGGSGNINLNGASAQLVISDGAGQTHTGAISGTGKLVKSGTGTQTISGNNSYSGGTQVNGGLLICANSLAAGVGSLTVGSGAAFAYEPTFASPLNLGAAILNIGNNTRIGTAIGGNPGDSTISTSSNAIAAGAVTIDVYGIPGAMTSSGTTPLITAASGLSGATYTLGNIYNATNFTLGSLTSTDTDVSISVNSVAELTTAYWKGGFSGGNNVWAITNGSSASNWTSNAAGTTATSLTPGIGTLVRFSATGATNQTSTVLGANMSVKGLSFGDTNAVTLTSDGNTLTVDQSGISVDSGAGAVTLGTPLIAATNHSWVNNSSNPLTLAGNVSGQSSTLTIDGTGNTTVSGNLTGDGAIFKSGSGTLTLSGSNTHTGEITVDAGTVKAGSVNAFGGLPRITLADVAGATLDVTSVSTSVGSIAGGGSSGGTVSLGNSTLTVGGTSLSDTFSGAITGAGVLNKAGTGTLTLDGSVSNTHGTTSVLNGAVYLSKSGGAIASGNLTFDNNLSPDVYTTADNQFASGTVVSFVNNAGDHGRLELIGTTQTVAGIQTVGYTAQRGVVQNREFGPANNGNSTLVLNGSGSYTFTGYLRNNSAANNGTLALTKSGSGTQNLVGSQIIHTGTTTVTGGTLRLTDTTAFSSPINNTSIVEFVSNSTSSQIRASISGSGVYNKTGPSTTLFNTAMAVTATGQINVLEGTLRNDGNAVNWSGSLADVNVAAGAFLDLYADAIYVDGLTGSGIIQNSFGNATGQSGSAANIEKLVVGTNNAVATFSGIIRNNPLGNAPAASTAGGGVQLEKVGTGTQTLTGISSYTGTTTVTAGTLRVDGALASGSAVTVAPGATLAGNGTAAGSVTANGIIAPGASIGTLRTGAVSFSATGSLAAEIDSTSIQADKLVVTGNLNIATGATLNLSDLGTGTLSNQKLVLITYTGAWNGGTFDGLADDSNLTLNGNTYTLNYNDTADGVNAVTLSVVQTSTPYSLWADLYSLTGGDRDLGADPDGDGVKNILEFATSANPTNGSSGPRVYPLVHNIGGNDVLTYTVAVRKDATFAASGNKQTATKDGVVYTVEATNDFTTWTSVQVTEITGGDATAVRTALGTLITSPALPADWEWHTFRTDGSVSIDASDFIRLHVAEDAP